MNIPGYSPAATEQSYETGTARAETFLFCGCLVTALILSILTFLPLNHSLHVAVFCQVFVSVRFTS